MISRRTALLTLGGAGLAGGAVAAGSGRLHGLAGIGARIDTALGGDIPTAGARVGAGSANAPAATPHAARLIAAARRQIGVTTGYNPAYLKLAYPGGDPPRATGVCTDVVIRAYRDALNLDLQMLVHQDMAPNFTSYPRRWGLKRTDTNIDHRRVPNLQRYFERKNSKLAIGQEWRPGDLYTCLVNGNLPHIAIVSDRLGPSGQLCLIHNIGQGTREEDLLGYFRPDGRYRWRV